MGRNKSNHVHNYYTRDTKNNTSKCNKCGKILIGCHSSNLLRHFYARHHDDYVEIMQKNLINRSSATEKHNDSVGRTSLINDPNESRSQSSPNNQVNESKIWSLPIEKQIEPKSWSVPINNENETHSRILGCCLNLIASNEGPLSMLDNTAFQDLINMIPGAEDLSISSTSVQVFIQEKAHEIRQNIFNEIKYKLLALKVDVGCVKFRRFLGLSIQYIHEDKVILRHLGVIELRQSNTGLHLKKSVMFTMSQYGIEIKQIYDITTDNGTNMLCTTREVNGIFEEDFLEVTPIDEEDYKQLVAELQFLAPNETLPTVFAVRSAAYTFQSAVDDACSDQQELFQIVRNAARVLRSPKLAAELKSQQFSNAVIDNPARWDSTAHMLERFITLKSFCEDSSDEFLNLPEASWIEIRNTQKTLKICRKLLKRVQKEQLTFGDFFIQWTQCLLKLENIATPFALRVLSCMKKHQDTLLANNSFLAALYLDPRVNFFLTETQTTLARNHLIKTFQKLDKLNHTSRQPLQPSASKNESMLHEMDDDDSNNSYLFMEVKQENVETDNSPTNIVDEYFRNIYLERQRQNSARSECEIFFPLLEFLNEPYVSTDESILEFWRKRKVTHSRLYTLASTVLSTPTTQVSVERLFSILENILTDPRMSSNEKVINDLLVIRCYYSYN